MIPDFKKAKLLYSMAKNGNSLKKYHSNCDNIKGPILMIFISTNIAVWGAITTVPISSVDNPFVKDEGAFLFTISESNCVVYKPKRPD